MHRSLLGYFTTWQLDSWLDSNFSWLDPHALIMQVELTEKLDVQVEALKQFTETLSRHIDAKAEAILQATQR